MQSNKNDTNDTNEHAPITEAELVNLESNSAFLAGVNLPDAKDEMLKITNRLIAEVRRLRQLISESGTMPLMDDTDGNVGEGSRVLTKKIIYFGHETIVGCDGKCEKAWGNQSRPVDDEDRMLADHELGDAPVSPGTYEGECGKPTTQDERLNKWCARECERSAINRVGTAPVEENLVLPDFSKRVH